MQPGHYPGIQALRGVAALLVVVQHAGFFAAQAAGADYLAFLKVDFGSLGVLTFFTISGFVIGLNRNVPTGTFLTRRALRIYPAFWAAYALSAAIVATVGLQTVFWWQTAFLLPATTMPALYVPAWTLIFEVFFYACAALLFWFRLPDRTMTFIALGWILLIHGMQFYMQGTRYYLPGALIPFAQYNQFFALGLLCALNADKLSQFSSNQMLVVAIAAVAALPLFPGLPHASSALVMGLALSALLVGATRVAALPRAAIFLGDVSYGVFLIHHSAIVATATALTGTSLPIPVLWPLLIVVALAAGVPFGLAEYQFYRRATRWASSAGRFGIAKHT